MNAKHTPGPWTLGDRDGPFIDIDAKQHGGPRPGSGRKTIAGEVMVRVTYRFTSAQKAKVARLGGVDWLRKVIDREEEK